MKFAVVRKPLLIFCLTASIALHIGAVWFLYAHPFKMVESDSLSMIKPSPDPKFIPKEDETLFAQKVERALEESLNRVVSLSQSSLHQQLVASTQKEEEDHKIPQLHAKPAISEDFFVLETGNEEFAATMPPLFDPELEESLSSFALDEEEEEELFPFESEKVASVDFTDHRLRENPPPVAQIFEDDYTMTDAQFSPSSLPLEQSKSLTTQYIASLKTLEVAKAPVSEEMDEEKMFTALEESTSPKLVLPNSVDYLRSQWVKRSLAERHMPELDHYGLDEIASNIEWEDDLNIQVVMSPDPTGTKYVFSLEIEPEFEADCAPMNQNFYFLIDRSSAVEKNKFNRFKRAVQRSMAALCDGDHFNIYIFDKKIEKLSDRALPVSARTLSMAEDFLEKQNAKTHFAASDPYVSLEKMLPERFDPEELHSVLLITDGNTLLSPTKQKRALSNWANRFEGNVQFYTAACGRGNNLVLLDLLSYVTGGKLLYSDTNAAFPRKLVRLVRDLHNPIMKNVTIEVSGADPHAQVTLFPKRQLLPPMYGGKNYQVVGTIDELCDLNVFIQGRNHDRWLNIRKQVTMHDAPRGGRQLEKLWATTQSKICYDHFLQNGKTAHLREAKQIVAPYKGTIALDE